MIVYLAYEGQRLNKKNHIWMMKRRDDNGGDTIC
jgi:hypothetical protein